MAQRDVQEADVSPARSELAVAHVLRRELVSPHLMRVTVGGDGLADFVPLGFDQWFRLFIPVSDGSLARVPSRLTRLSYLRFLTIAKTERPVLRNYTVRGFRADGPDGPELDIDFVLHGSAADGTAGPASSWAATCSRGDAVALLDEGILFKPPAGVDDLRLVADETGLPAVAGILASLPPTATGRAIVEVPTADDRQDLVTAAQVDVEWIVRDDPQSTPGAGALAAAVAEPVPSGRLYGWVAGESALPVGLRRHWVAAGVPKDDISFCGYWRADRSH